MPAHARAAVIAMEARAKNGDASYHLTDPDNETHLLTIQFYDRTSILNPCRQEPVCDGVRGHRLLGDPVLGGIDDLADIAEDGFNIIMSDPDCLHFG